MADNIWDNSDADNDGNVAANWSLGNVPTAGDVAVFDSGTTDANCTFSGNLSCDGMRFDNTYAGTVDAVTHDITLGTDGFDCTGGGSATLLMGTGSTWTCAGHWDDADLGTKTRETSTVVLSGTSKNLITNFAKNFHNLTASGTITSGSVLDVRVALIVSGELTLNGTVYNSNNAGAITSVTGTGTLGGSGTLNVIKIDQQDNILSISTLKVTSVYGNSSIVPATYASSTLSFDGVSSPARSLTLSAGSYTFTGNVTYDDKGGSSFTVIHSGAVNIAFQGDVTLTETGTLNWTKGSGTITLSGSNNQTITTPGGWTDVLEDIVINKTAGAVTGPANGLYAESFTGTSTGTGTFDPNGGTYDFTGACSWAAAFDFASAADTMNGSDWQVDGNFTADGQTLNASAGWDLDVTGTAVASGTGAVAYSTAGGTEITATGWTDNSNNTNWDFGAVPAGSSQQLTLLGVG